MPFCNRCKHQSEIDALEQQRKRLAEICLKCHGPCDDNHSGISFVSLDAFGNEINPLAADDSTSPVFQCAGMNVEPTYRPNDARPELKLGNLSQEAVDAAIKAIRPFTELGIFDAVLVVFMMHGFSQVKIAERLGVSKQLVWLRWKLLLRDNPLWYSIRTHMIGFRKGGRKKGQIQERRKPLIDQCFDIKNKADKKAVEFMRAESESFPPTPAEPPDDFQEPWPTCADVADQEAEAERLDDA